MLKVLPILFIFAQVHSTKSDYMDWKFSKIFNAMNSHKIKFPLIGL